LSPEVLKALPTVDVALSVSESKLILLII
jgi:hypothetical protein